MSSKVVDIARGGAVAPVLCLLQGARVVYATVQCQNDLMRLAPFFFRPLGTMRRRPPFLSTFFQVHPEAATYDHVFPKMLTEATYISKLDCRIFMYVLKLLAFSTRCGYKPKQTKRLSADVHGILKFEKDNSTGGFETVWHSRSRNRIWRFDLWSCVRSSKRISAHGFGFRTE